MSAQYPYVLVIKEGSSAGKTYPLEGDEILIGRDPNNTLQIDSPGVSRKHARLTYQNNHYLLEDLGSSNGTFVNGERISKPWPLKNGDSISLGRMIQLEYQVALPPMSATMIESEYPLVGGTIIEEEIQQPQVHVQPTPAPPIEIPPPLEPQMTMVGQDMPVPQKITPPQLIVTIAGQELKTYDLGKLKVTIGRSEDNEIVIDSRIVSRHHAYLDRVQDGYLLTVLPEAANPVLFDGRPLTPSHKLQHGDILRIGSLDPGMAQYGDLTRGPRVVTEETKKEMKRILQEIQDGVFAKEWILECRANKPTFNALTKKGERHLIEEFGGRLRAMMPWLKKGKLVDKSKAKPCRTPEKSSTENAMFRYAPEGYPFIFGFLAVTAVTAIFSVWGALFPALLTLFMFYFFRDPGRQAPADADVIVSPADGKVTLIRDISEPRYLRGEAKEVSIFMSPFNVHVNRAPCEGKVKAVVHNRGRFMAAYREEASVKNENIEMVLETRYGDLLVRQVGGFVARRAVCRTKEGDILLRGERYGIIKFSCSTA